MYSHKNRIIFTLLLHFPLALFSASTARIDRYWSEQYKNYLIQYPHEDISIALRIPDTEERIKIINEVLSLCLKYADQDFIQDLAQHTKGFNILQIKAFVVGLANASLGDKLDRKVYQEELDYLESHSITHNQKIPLDQSLTLDFDTEKISPNDNQYPLLKDIYHSKKNYFADATAQLKQGQFRKDFRQGILLYGPPGVGKSEVVEAIKNESKCTIIRIKASELVERYQGTGSSAIKSAFDAARTVDPKKGVIVFIDELQSLCPVTTKENIEYTHKYEGQDYQNTLSQIWIELDECSRDHKNTLVIMTTNNLDRVDERMRERVKCVEFPYPDEAGVAEILHNKAQYFDVPITQADLKKYTKKMKGLSGRKITTFVADAKTYVNDGYDTKKALEQSYKDQCKTIEDSKQYDTSTMDIVKDYSIKGAKVVGTGALMYIGGAVVGPAVVTGTKATVAGASALLAKIGITTTTAATAVIAHKIIAETLIKDVIDEEDPAG